MTKDSMSIEQFNADIVMSGGKFKEKDNTGRGGSSNVKYKAKKGFEWNYASPLEAEVAKQLDYLQELGLIKFWQPQFPFRLPGDINHYVDFIVMTLYEQIIFIEAKGRDRRVGKNKRIQVESIYEITINVVRKAKEVDNIILAYNEGRS